jgi:hypothetical protein
VSGEAVERHPNVRHVGIIGYHAPVLLNRHVQGCEPLLRHFSPPRFRDIQGGSVSQLSCREVFGARADPPLDVIRRQPQRFTSRYAAERHMNVRVLRVEMGNRHPFERVAEVGFHAAE